MNKSLFRLAGTIIAFEALYIIFYFFPLIASNLTNNATVLMEVGLLVLGVILLLISGVGFLFAKKWAVTTLWISLALSFVVSVVMGHSFPAFISGGFLSWVTDLIIAVYLTVELKVQKI